MKNKFLGFTIVLLLGMFFLPSAAIACETKATKECCQKETTKHQTEKECCSNKHSDKENKGCEGKCGHSNCTTTSVHNSFITSSNTDLQTVLFDFSTEKPNLYYAETFLSSGFYSIWQPPKIG